MFARSAMNPETSTRSSIAIAIANRTSVNSRRAALFLNLPRLLATYFDKYGKQPQTSSVFPPGELHEDGASVRIHDNISTGSDTDLPEESKAETSIHKDLEGFFLWLDVEAEGGKYAGIIECNPGSRLGFLKEFLCKPIGSGINGQPLVMLLCYNRTPNGACRFAASKDTICKHCWLAKYCSLKCAVAHGPRHTDGCKYCTVNKVDLSFPLQALVKVGGRNLPERADDICNPVLPVYGLLRDLVPSTCAPLVQDDRQQTVTVTSPGSRSDDPAAKVTSNPQKFPRKCVLPDHVRLFFPSLYDLRNIFETIRNIPDDYTGSVTLFLNFSQATLALRDFLILELLRYHGAAAIDLAIGLWYSSTVTAAQDTHLMLTILRMLHTWQSTLSAMGTQHLSATYQQSFPQSSMGSSLRADFGISIWSKLRELVCSDESNRRGFNYKVQYARRWNADAKVKADACCPPHLASWIGYEKAGALLPYGISKLQHNTLNRLRYSARSNHIARYKNGPESGWDWKQIFPPVRGACEGDLHGCLFFRLREMMEVFVQKTASCCVRLRLMQFQTRKLFRIIKDSGLKFQRIDASALSSDKEVSLEEVMDWCGGLLAENATEAWPSLLLTMTCEEKNIEAEVVSEAYKKGVEIKREMMTVAAGQEFSPFKTFWKAIEPVTVSTYVGLFKTKELSCSSSNEETGGEKHVAAQMKLQKQKRHCIVSHIPGVSLEDSLQPLPTDTADKYVRETFVPYFNLVFSGFTFRERFHEWGWALGQ